MTNTNRLTADKDINKILADLLRGGWTYYKKRRHIKMYSPDGVFRLTVPVSPSDRRARLNFQAQLKRVLVEVEHDANRRNDTSSGHGVGTVLGETTPTRGRGMGNSTSASASSSGMAGSGRPQVQENAVAQNKEITEAGVQASGSTNTKEFSGRGTLMSTRIKVHVEYNGTLLHVGNSTVRNIQKTSDGNIVAGYYDRLIKEQVFSAIGLNRTGLRIDFHGNSARVYNKHNVYLCTVTLYVSGQEDNRKPSTLFSGVADRFSWWQKTMVNAHDDFDFSSISIRTAVQRALDKGRIRWYAKYERDLDEAPYSADAQVKLDTADEYAGPQTTDEYIAAASKVISQAVLPPVTAPSLPTPATDTLTELVSMGLYYDADGKVSLRVNMPQFVSDFILDIVTRGK